MKLELDRIDLMSEHAERNCSTIHFEHFKPDVQAAIIATGRATFYEFGRDNYNAIYPPKDAPAPDAALLAAAKRILDDWDNAPGADWCNIAELINADLRAAIAQAEAAK